MVQMLARFWGVVFVVVGLLGFDPVVTHVDDLGLAGPDSDAELFGLFQVSVLHNVLHLLLGVAGIALARTWEGGRAFLLGAALTYLALFVLGLVTSATSDANFVPTNGADDILHLVFGILLLLGWVVNMDDRDRVSLG